MEIIAFEKNTCRLDVGDMMQVQSKCGLSDDPEARMALRNNLVHQLKAMVTGTCLECEFIVETSIFRPPNGLSQGEIQSVNLTASCTNARFFSIGEGFAVHGVRGAFLDIRLTALCINAIFSQLEQHTYFSFLFI
jgi:hypothetical protein